MKGKYAAPNSRLPIFPIVLLLILALISGSLALCLMLGGGEDDTPATEPPTSEVTEAPTSEPTEPPTEPGPEPLTVVSTATILSTGDILPHDTLQEAHRLTDGSYDFGPMWDLVRDRISGADYAVANLETTLCGKDNGYGYGGFPHFNAPDQLAQSARDAGFDMLLTANNHCNDTFHVGLVRTVTTVRELGLATLGTYPTADEPRYAVVDINGIKIGMLCYTYGTISKTGHVAVNGIGTQAESAGLINVFDYGKLDQFYAEVSASMASMEAEGAEACVMYIHWGNEYRRNPHENQRKIAQSLCDLGIDVIVGGHPHVIQPMDLLTSTTDEGHKTVCIYSVGNAISNQRLGLISSSSTAHTEDGMFFSITFSRYSDGSVALTAADIQPFWVNRHNNDNGAMVYDMVPLDADKQAEWATLYGLTEGEYRCCVQSYERTQALVSEGLKLCQDYLAQAHTRRVEDYWNAQLSGEPGAGPSEPTEATGE